MLSAQQVIAVYEKLQILTNVDEAVKQAHIDNINKKYKDIPQKEILPEPVITNEETPAASDAALICPKCGSPLVLRKAKKGANAGNQFYGCSNFPHCRYIRSLEE